MNTKSNLLKSIFISLILLVGGTSKISAAVTFTADDILFFNMSAVSWWTAGNNGDGNFAYFYNNSAGKNAWSAHAVQYSGSVYYVKIPAGTWEGVILTRNNTSTAPSWNNKWNQTGDISLLPTSNYISKFSEGSTSVTWDTQKPTSTGSLAASATSVNIGSNVTLTPSLTSNTTYNEIKSTSYSISPNSGASISGNTFTATAAGTYTVTATVTYNPRGYSSLTSTVEPTVTITVKQPTHTVTFGVHSSGNGTLTATAASNSISSGASVDEGTEVVFTANPSPGYQVEGWYSNSTCTTSLSNGKNNTYTINSLTAAANVYVKFEEMPATSHNITYTPQKTGWTYDANNPTSAEEGEKVSFTVTPATGYSVTVKSDVDLEKNGNIYTFEMPSKDVEIDVTATEILSTITIYATPEEAGSVLVNGQPFTAGGTVKVGIATSVEVTAVPNDGYGVAAWSRTEGVVNHLSGSNPITITTYGTGADGVLRANFIGLEYTITFNKQEGTNGTDKATVRYKNNEYSVSPVEAPTRAGYTFGGYYTQAAGAGVQVVSAEGQWLANATDYTDADRKWLVKENTTLYAKWVELPPTTIYVKTDGNCTDLKWNSTGMETLDCEGIYYTANIPASVSEITITGSNNFTTTALTVPTDDNILYDISQNLIYLTPNSNWTQASARFAAAFLNSNKSTTEWVSMTSVGNGIYNCAIPDGSWKYVIFCRMNPSAAANNWDNKWNQTEDLEIPTDAKNLYTVKSGTWDKGGGSWSAHYDNSCWTAYSAPTYTINTESGEGGTIEISPSSPVALNEQITVTMIPEDGYTFKSGTITMGNQTPITITEVISTYTICGPTTITATWKPNSHTVTFDANGHSTAPEAQPVDHDAKVTAPTAPEATGYTFSGWYKEAECTTEWNFNSDVVTGDITLYAKWTPNTYTVAFNANDGKGEMSAQSFTYNEDAKALTTNVFTRTGYTFAGWNTVADGSGTSYTNEQSVYNLTAENNATINLYAQWTANTYTVTFNANGGTGTMAAQEFTYDVEKALTANTFTNGDLVFLGWATSAEGAVEYTDKQSVSNLAANNGETVTLYAVWATLKTIYLKTVEGTADGEKWFVKYGETEKEMTELGCTDEFYTAVVPEQTEFQFISKDNSGNVVETKGGNILPNDEKNLFNLVAAGASGDKIFFKPNSHWLTKQNGKTPRFAAHFYNPNEEWIDLVATNSDGIYECEKPAGGYTQIQFCRMKENTTENNWNNKSEQTLDLTIPTDGKNLFTVDANQELGGNNDSGTWSEFADTPVNGEGAWEVFEGITYRITFVQTGATSGETTEGTTYVDAQYGAAMPAIESLPTNTDWKFGGYYTQANGQGTKITNAFGDWLDADGYISDGKWAKETCITLYANWVEKTPEITVVTLDKEAFDAGTAETVTATPSVEKYSYEGTFTICWKMLDNAGTVMELFPFTPGDNNSVTFSTDGLTTGTYTVRASIYASACDEGEELSRYDKKFTIVSGYKVTVKYLCDGEVIQAPTIVEGHASNATEITAPEIGGYKFVQWELGDGISSESDLKSQAISYTAIYDGYLTAKYEKRKLIFLDLSNQFGETEWTEPHIYLYSGSYWDDTNGTGGNHANCIANGAMTRVGTSNIWYYDYESVKNFNGYVAFTPTDQSALSRFKDTEAIYRYDFSSGTPVFVPAQGQIPHSANQVNYTKAQYYNKGHWTKYMGGTGYTLKIYNKKENERTEVMSVPFTGSSLYLPFTAIADLEDGKTYGYKIVRDNDKWYKNDADGTMTSTSCTNWPFVEDNSNGLACGIQTVATGDHTFTLTLNATTGNLEVSVDYPAKVGNYRILYTDDVRNKRYKPSQIISQNNKEPLVSFFIRPNKKDNPTLKVQKAAYVTNEAVTWFTTENEIFFKPNANWKSDGARFAAYFYNASNNKWVDMKANGDLYSCAKPTDKAYTHVIFCRMNPSAATNNWNNKWNQTGHLVLTTKNLYTLKEGEWGNKLYLKPNSNWFQKDNEQKDPRFAAYFFNSNSDYTWVSMGNPVDGVYSCDIPAKVYKSVIFCRMNGGNETNDWSNKYNQSSDLTIPTDGKTLYTVKDGTWDNGGGSWSEREGSWSELSGGITDLTTQLTDKLAELDLKNIKEKEGSVFNIHLSNNEGTLTIEKVAFYTGNYYIRVDAVDGKWYDYKTNPDNLMNYSAFSESDANSFGEKFSHYKTKWCEINTNVKFVIANDYSLCISDTLTQDEGNPFGNIDVHGNINNNDKYKANIRFMWNRHTNKISRAYVAGASDPKYKFLVLKANKPIQNEAGQAYSNNEVVFQDTQNWLYERTIKVQPGTRVKLYACYPDVDEAKAQHFRGKYNTPATFDADNSVQLLGGISSEWYTMRLIYDFKTNRLMAAWVPDQNINGTLEIDADVMVIRQHQEDATCITFANDKSALTAVKTVYGVMRFNRWTLNNRSTSTHDVLPLKEQKTIYERALYFISFPFDVHLSDVFGFGTYGTHWVISEYNGLRRAQNGYFVDNCMNEDCTNWDYIWDPSNFTMKANQGYLLSLDLDLMKSDNESFWAHGINQVELFFPSFKAVQTIQQTEYTTPALNEKYLCKHKGHEVIDSYWRCIGVPSFADYNGSLYGSEQDYQNKTPFKWNPKGSDLPYLYEWNVSDNSLMVRAATNYKFRSTFAYLVQNGNSIYWSAVNTKPSNIVARQQAESKNYEWRLTLTRNEQVEDQTFIRLANDEKITNNFDFNQDLSKEFNYGRSDIYTLIGYEKAAANSLPLSEQTTVIPLGLSIEYNGDYTIAMPDGTANIGVTLIDTESNTRTNLSAGMEYTLTLKKGDYNNRFFIEISPIQQTPTDIEYVENSHDDQARKVLIDNILYIVRDGQIFDARGARVK